MKVAFRADASVALGAGHVSRCLALADAGRERGMVSRFICRELDGDLSALIESRGYETRRLAASAPDAPAGPADWFVVDHYDLDATWEAAARAIGGRVMAIDDLADRAHDCELLLDQNLGRDAADYAGLVPPSCRILAGPSYALLRPEFAEWRDRSLARRAEPHVQRLLISMGGADQHNVTSVVLDAIRHAAIPRDASITVVMGQQAPWLEQVRTDAATMPWPTAVVTGATNMAELMTGSDLAIGAGGGTSWERCCLGLPTLVVILADNQSLGATALDAGGAAIAIKNDETLGATLVEAIARCREAGVLSAMSQAARHICDGAGASRVVEAMIDAAR